MQLEIRTSGHCRPLGFKRPFPARYLIWHGADGPLVIDAGYGEKPVTQPWNEKIYARLFRVTYGSPLPACNRILITHHHIDHIGGLNGQACAGPAPPAVGGPWQQLHRATFSRTLPVRQTVLPSWTHERLGFPAVHWHDLEVLHLPGHTHNHTGVYFPRLHLLYVADAVWYLRWFKRPAPPRWAMLLQEDRQSFATTFARLQSVLAGDRTLRVRCAHDPDQPAYEIIPV